MVAYLGDDQVCGEVADQCIIAKGVCCDPTKPIAGDFISFIFI